MKNIFESFVNDFDFAQNTKKAFRSDLRNFAEWYTAHNKEPYTIHRTTARDVIDFRDYLQKTYAVSTANRHLVALRRFFQWAVDQNMISTNPVSKVKEIRQQSSTAPKGLEQNQIRKFLKEVELRGSLRDMLVVAVLLYTGCRVGDLCKIKRGDIFITERSGSIRFLGKGRKERVVPLPLQARKVLNQWFDQNEIQPDERIIKSTRGHLTERGVRNLLEKYSRICGFHVHPHLLRHCCAKRLLEKTDLATVSEILGHSRLDTTAIYTKKSQQQISEQLDDFDF